MKSFVEAHRYIRDTSPQEIAERAYIFNEFFFYYKGQKQNEMVFGHDIIVDIVSALHGPFDENVLADRMIFDYVNYVGYGVYTKWTDLSMEWARKNATSELEFLSFCNMMQILFSGKADRILEQFNIIVYKMEDPMLYDSVMNLILRSLDKKNNTSSGFYDSNDTLDINSASREEALIEYRNMNIEWQFLTGLVMEGVGDQVGYISRSFYTSSYLCPECGKSLYKSVVNTTLHVSNVNPNERQVNNVFACPRCKSMFAVQKGFKLGGGYYFKMNNKPKYDKVFKLMDLIGLDFEELRREANPYWS